MARPAGAVQLRVVAYLDITGTSNVSYGNPALGNPISAAWNRGNSSADVPWSWITNGIYQAPSLRDKGRLMEETVGGWQLSGIINLQKGSPFGIGQWNSDPGVGMWNDRADFVPGQAVNMGKGNHWDWVNSTKGYFNEAAFIDPYGTTTGHTTPPATTKLRDGAASATPARTPTLDLASSASMHRS